MITKAGVYVRIGSDFTEEKSYRKIAPLVFTYLDKPLSVPTQETSL